MLTGEVILVVEDQWIIADAIRAQLEKEGVVVYTAATAAEAIKIADDPELTLAVLGIQLIDATSDAACERLAKHSVPFVFCTSYIDHPIVHRWKAPAIAKPAPVWAICKALIDRRRHSGEGGFPV